MDIHYFHAWLRQSLRYRSTEIRSNFNDRLPTSEELDVITLLQRLSDDIENVSEHVFLLFQMMLLIGRVAVDFERVSYALFQKVGIDFVPRDASDLVRWLMIETLHGERGQNASAELGHRR